MKHDFNDYQSYEEAIAKKLMTKKDSHSSPPPIPFVLKYTL